MTKLPKIIKDQILLVRSTGKTNMFDRKGVMRVALETNLYELIIYLSDEDNAKAYFDFILYGDEEE